MTKLRQRMPRLKLPLAEYQALRNRVLERDRWRCQLCGTSRRFAGPPLEVTQQAWGRHGAKSDYLVCKVPRKHSTTALPSYPTEVQKGVVERSAPERSFNRWKSGRWNPAARYSPGFPLASLPNRFLHRHIAVGSPLRDGVIRGRCGRNDVPNSVRGPPHGDVRLRVAIIIYWHRNVPACPPLLEDRNARVAAGEDEPNSVRGSKHGDVRLPITIVVSRHWHVAAYTPLPKDRSARVRAGDDEPRPVRGSKHGDVRLPITIVISRHGTSPLLPHCFTIGLLGLLLGMMNHVPFEGRNTAMSSSHHHRNLLAPEYLPPCPTAAPESSSACCWG